MRAAPVKSSRRPLLVSHSADGVHWQPNSRVQNQSSKAAPALLGL
jgi:hypothetical protein